MKKKSSKSPSAPSAAPPADSACGCAGRDCRGRAPVTRRDFLRTAGAAGAGVLALPALRMPVMAGPFEDDNAYLQLIPTDKRLHPDWVASLFARGEPETVSDPAALQHIGMPVGGFCAGTVYLGGDGRLWLWDIFNRDQEGVLPRPTRLPEGAGVAPNTRGGLNYVEPAPFTQPFRQEFALRVGDRTRPLDHTGFTKVTFEGRYPIGRVRYEDPDCPVHVELEAFSPFIPLNLDDSSLPATVMHYMLKNTSDQPVEVELRGVLQNAICADAGATGPGGRRNRIARADDGLRLDCFAVTRDETAGGGAAEARPDIVFEDWNQERYEGWTAEGSAFGQGPVLRKDFPAHQGDPGGPGARVVNSHASAPGASSDERDHATGTLTSDPFPIERGYIHFWIGGGHHAGGTCINLLVDGQAVQSAVGTNENRMQRAAFDVRSLAGRTARLQIVDDQAGSWGHIAIGEIIFSDAPPAASNRLEDQRDFGTMALALLGRSQATDLATAAEADGAAAGAAAGWSDPPPVGALGRRWTLAPGAEAEATFVLAWHFPNFYARDHQNQRLGQYYATRFDSAAAVARYVAANFERLAGETRLWVETWYDSTLPHWFLNRTMANTSTLATTTCYRFESGRFWAWEGVGCCGGTCTHVWHYAHAPGRLFPELERDLREQVDFGTAQHPDGGIGHREWNGRKLYPADDGHCGRILGAYREHQMSSNDAFLRRTWPHIRKAVEYMIRRDGDGDGMVEGAQHNTLDAAWYGKIAFLASLYLAALRAGEAMATEVGDEEFAQQCRTIAERGAQSILELYNGEYFIQIQDPAHANHIATGEGCYIDQIFGQSWAHQVGLGVLFDHEKQLSALQALWKYNFVPDVGPFREKFRLGRWYAVAGDAGLLMCTWPRGGHRKEWMQHWQYMYFNECMSGFEWQVAAHMIHEGMVEEGLAVSRAIHDRYAAARRNPYNEIECSDHYARAMASYGAFLSACGYEYHGPKGHLGFAPRLTPERFRAPFTAAEGWGTFQQVLGVNPRYRIMVKWGRLRVKTLALQTRTDPRTLTLTLGGRRLVSTHTFEDGRLLVTLAEDAVIDAGQTLDIQG